MAFGNCMWGTRLLKKPPTPNFMYARSYDGAERDAGQCGSDRQGAGGRTCPGQDAQQVTKQDEEEYVPQEGQELVGVVLADRRPGDLIANEHQHHFEEVPEQPLGRTAATHAPWPG